MFVLTVEYSTGTFYFIRDNPDEPTYDVVHLAYYATKFVTESVANEYVEKYITDSMREHVSVMNVNDVPEFNPVYQTKQKLDQFKSVQYDPLKHTSDDVFNFYWDHCVNEGSINYSDYRTWPQVWEVFKNIHSVNAHYGTLHPDDNALIRSFEIQVTKNSVFSDFQSEIMQYVDRIEHVDDDGNKIISIHDHYLWRGGDHCVLYYNPIKKTWWVDGSEQFDETDDLESIFNWIKKKRWANTYY